MRRTLPLIGLVFGEEGDRLRCTEEVTLEQDWGDEAARQGAPRCQQHRKPGDGRKQPADASIPPSLLFSAPQSVALGYSGSDTPHRWQRGPRPGERWRGAQVTGEGGEKWLDSAGGAALEERSGVWRAR